MCKSRSAVRLHSQQLRDIGMSVTYVEKSHLRQTVSGGATLDIALAARIIENYDAARDELEISSGLESAWMSFSAGVLKLTLVPLLTESRDFEIGLRARRSGGDWVATTYLLTVRPLTLLPPNATEFERNLEAALLWRLLRLFEGANADPRDMAVPARYAWNPDKISSALLPYLAHTFSVDVWDDSWSDTLKRQAIRQSYQRHSEKGTFKSIVDALAYLGETGATITEGDAVSWANYAIRINNTLTIEDLQSIATFVESVAPIRSRLTHISFVNYVYDDTIDYDGANTYGVFAL